MRYPASLKVFPTAAVGLAILMAGVALASVEVQTTAAGVTEPFQDVVLSARMADTVEKQLVKGSVTLQTGQMLIAMKKHQKELNVKRRKLIDDSKGQNLYKSRKQFVTLSQKAGNPL